LTKFKWKTYSTRVAVKLPSWRTNWYIYREYKRRQRESLQLLEKRIRADFGEKVYHHGDLV
jgi:hypothetical protein